MGVPGTRVDTVAGFRAAFAQALAAPGPVLIEAMV
jgi:thiamine pyrophosphate-dependent acetolactate synthase large subunit-like protein